MPSKPNMVALCYSNKKCTEVSKIWNVWQNPASDLFTWIKTRLCLTLNQLNKAPTGSRGTYIANKITFFFTERFSNCVQTTWLSLYWPSSDFSVFSKISSTFPGNGLKVRWSNLHYPFYILSDIQLSYDPHVVLSQCVCSVIERHVGRMKVTWAHYVLVNSQTQKS